MDYESEVSKFKDAQADQIRLVSESELPSNTYENLVMIAEGATGIVYSANRISDKYPVAIKIYKKELIPDSEASRRFKHEVETLGKVSHPNIVKILDHGTNAAGQSYIAMELLDGVSIRTLLETEGVFEPRRAATIAREICRALSSLHGQGIIHRDLKPNNIIIDQNNVTKIVDFGVAKVLNASGDTITQYGTVIGTPTYMSPEQCLGQKLDQRSDIYSLGCTLFEMLTGMKAFESNTAMEALAKQINGDRAFVEKLLAAASAPQDLRTVVGKCLSREPDERYETVAQLDHDLGAFLLGAPLAFSSKPKVHKGTSANERATNQWWQVGVGSVAILATLYVIQSNMAAIRSSTTGSPLVAQSPKPFKTANSVDETPAGIDIKNRNDGKILFSDPKARNLQEAVKAASVRGVSLSFADLRNVDLTNVSLSSLNLSFADLTNAQFTQAKLTDVNFHGANLQNSTFLQASMIGVNFSDAKLSGANLNQCTAPGCSFAGADLQSASIDQAHFEGANFRYANLSDARAFSASFNRANLSFADFSGVNMRAIGREGLKDANVFNAKNMNLTGL